MGCLGKKKDKNSILRKYNHLDLVIRNEKEVMGKTDSRITS